MMFLADKTGTENLIDYSSITSRRVVRPVLGEESFGLADACDAAIILHHDLPKIRRRTVKIAILADSATLFNALIRYAPNT